MFCKLWFIKTSKQFGLCFIEAQYGTPTVDGFLRQPLLSHNDSGCVQTSIPVALYHYLVNDEIMKVKMVLLVWHLSWKLTLLYKLQQLRKDDMFYIKVKHI